MNLAGNPYVLSGVSKSAPQTAREHINTQSDQPVNLHSNSVDKKTSNLPTIQRQVKDISDITGDARQAGQTSISRYRQCHMHLTLVVFNCEPCSREAKLQPIFPRRVGRGKEGGRSGGVMDYSSLRDLVWGALTTLDATK